MSEEITPYFLICSTEHTYKKKLHIHHFSEAQFIGVNERENHHKSSTVSFGGPQLMNQKTTVSKKQMTCNSDEENLEV